MARVTCVALRREAGEGIGARSVMFLLPLFLLVLPSLVGAMNLITYTQQRCLGSGVEYLDIQSAVCYSFEDDNVHSFTFTDNICDSYGYRLGLCREAVVARRGNICNSYYEGLKSARLYCTKTRLRQLLAAPEDRTDGDCVKPQMTGVVYTEDPSKGTWVLQAADAKEIFNQLTAVAEDEKLKWLQARGASFRPA